MKQIGIEDIVRGILATVVLAVFAYAALTGNSSCNELGSILLVVLGFYFGGSEIANVIKNITNKNNSGG